jgi:hypothetical protein
MCSTIPLPSCEQLCHRYCKTYHLSTLALVARWRACRVKPTEKRLDIHRKESRHSPKRDSRARLDFHNLIELQPGPSYFWPFVRAVRPAQTLSCAGMASKQAGGKEAVAFHLSREPSKEACLCRLPRRELPSCSFASRKTHGSPPNPAPSFYLRASLNHPVISKFLFTKNLAGQGCQSR